MTPIESGAAVPSARGRRNASAPSLLRTEERFYPEGWMLPGPAEPEESSAEGALLQAWRHCWRRALPLGLLVGLLAAVATWFLLPVQYTARALLHVASQPSRGLLTSQEIQESHEDFVAFQRTQATLLKSRDVMQAALRQPSVAASATIQEHAHPVQWLAEAIRIDSNLGPEILSVSLSGHHPEELPILVNTVVQAYLQELEGKERLRQPARVEQLQENYRRLEDGLRRKRAMLRELETSLGVEPAHMLGLRYQLALQLHSTLEKEQLQTRMALKGAQMELTVISNGTLAALPSSEAGELEQSLSRDTTYQFLVARKAQIAQDISQIRSVAAPGMRSSLTQGHTNQLAAIDAELTARRNALVPALQAQQRAKLELRVAVLQDQLKEMDAEVKHQSEEVKRLAAMMKQPDRPATDLDALRDDITQTEQVMKRVAEQREMYRLEPFLPLRVSSLETADVPQTIDSRRQLRIAGLTGSGIFCLVVLGMCLMEHRAHRVRSTDDVARLAGLPVIGTLPVMPSEPVLTLAGSDRNFHERAMLSVSITSLHHTLLNDEGSNPLHILLICNAASFEGKNALAAQLAISLAQAGYRTLLVDGDWHHPQVHKQLHLSPGHGLCDVLRDALPFQEASQPTSIPHLWAMSAGIADPACALALADEKSRSLFQRLKTEFDYIIIDSPPVLEHADALLLGKHADGAIFPVIRDVTQTSSLQEACKQLSQAHVRVLGAVVAERVSPSQPESSDTPIRMSRRTLARTR